MGCGSVRHRCQCPDQAARQRWCLRGCRTQAFHQLDTMMLAGAIKAEWDAQITKPVLICMDVITASGRGLLTG